MPDIASKKASTKRASVAPSMKGSDPNNGSTSQTLLVRMKVCCSVSPSFAPLLQASEIRLPVRKVSTAASKNTGQCPLPSARSTVSGGIMVSPRAATRRPITYPTGRRSNMAQGLAAARDAVKRHAATAAFPVWNLQM